MKIPISLPFNQNEIGVNAVILLSGQIFAQIIIFPVGIIIARTVGLTEYGQYATAMAFTTLFAGLFLFGIDIIVVREIAGRPTDANKIVTNSLVFSIILAVMVALMVNLVAYLLGYSIEIRTLVLLLTFDSILIACLNLYRAAYRGLQRMLRDALTQVFQSVMALVAVVLVLIFGPQHVVSFMIAIVCSRAILLVLTITGFPDIRVDFSQYKLSISQGLFQLAAPVGVAGVVSGLYQRLDTVMLGYWHPEQDIGLYNIAFIISYTWLPISISLSRSIFPQLSASFSSRNPDGFRAVFGKGLKYNLAAGIMVGVLILIAPEFIINLLYGKQYLEAASSLRIFGITTIYLFINTYFLNVLISIGRQTEFLRGSILGVIVMVMSGVFLMPRWGIEGAAVSVVIRETIIFIFYSFQLFFKKPSYLRP